MIRLLWLAACLMASPLFAQVSINEYSVNRGVADAGVETDWIEIINTGQTPEQLAGYFLSDKLDNPQKWPLPAYELQPGEILLVCASGENLSERIDHWESLVYAENSWKYRLGTSAPPNDWTAVGFDDSSWDNGNGGFGYGDGDDNTVISPVPSIYLRRTFQVFDMDDIASIAFHADYDDGYVAYLNGVEIARSENLPGSPPAFDDYATVDHEAQLYAGVTPTPAMFAPDELAGVLVEGVNVLSVQLHNVGPNSSDMTGIFNLSAGIWSSGYSYFQLPSWFSVDQANAYYHTNFRLSVGEHVILSTSTGTVDIDTIPAALSFGLSRGRSPDGTGDWCFFDAPSPDASNGASWCYDGVSPEPEFSLPSGWYDSPQLLSITSSNGVVRYTQNGDVPTDNDQVSATAITVDENAAFAARTFSSGNLLPSRVVDRTYIFSEDNHNLPVFSIHTDSLNLWDWQEGIYVSGPNASGTYPFYDSNFWQPWSKFARVEYFDGNQQLQATEHLDLEIHGGWSRAEPQKSFRLDFKSVYTGRLEVPLFSQKPQLGDFNNINLRNGGQHVGAGKIQDGLVSRVVNETHVDNVAYEPCILYLNGQYWGVYGIREKQDEHYLESNHGVASDAVDLLNPNYALAGSDAHFLETHELLMDLPANDPDFYALAASRFDLPNYIDYFIIETYIQNNDWLGIDWGVNNVKLWRPQTDTGKWRYLLYDTDAAFGYFGPTPWDNFIERARNPTVPNGHADLFAKLLENESFKCEFSNRYADLVNTIFHPDSFGSVTSELATQLLPTMTDHVARWGAPASILDWQGAIANMLQHAELRHTVALTHVNNSLSLNGTSELTVAVNPPGAGTIQISTITPNQYPWTGTYFEGCPVQIMAIPNDGFSFDAWSGNPSLPGGSTDAQVSITLEQDDLFTANFVADSAVGLAELAGAFSIFPNPAQEMIHVNYAGALAPQSTLRVTNAVGQEVYRSLPQSAAAGYSTSINVSNWPVGVYILELRSAAGHRVDKVVIAR